jgi:hypothetical protein
MTEVAATRMATVEKEDALKQSRHGIGWARLRVDSVVGNEF